MSESSPSSSSESSGSFWGWTCEVSSQWVSRVANRATLQRLKMSSSDKKALHCATAPHAKPNCYMHNRKRHQFDSTWHLGHVTRQCYKTKSGITKSSIETIAKPSRSNFAEKPRWEHMHSTVYGRHATCFNPPTDYISLPRFSPTMNESHYFNMFGI